MKRLVVYIVNVDEDLAEKALEDSLAVIALLPFIKVKPKSLYAEPYSDARGIIAYFDFDYSTPEADASKNASKALYNTLEELIKAHLWNIPAVKITLESGRKPE